jgi:hypothetical protein
MQRLRRTRYEGSAKRLALIGLLTLLTVVLFGLARWSTPAGGQQAAGNYSHPDTDIDCNGEDIDPLGEIFRGSDAGWETTMHNINYHAWPYGGIGIGTQNLKVYRQGTTSVCRDNNEGAGSYLFGDPPDDRFHIRIWLTWLPDKPKWTAGTPHWESDSSCGHFVVDYTYTYVNAGTSEGGFTYARKRLKQRFEQGGHSTDAYYWGNDKQIPQCGDHRAVGSDGWVVFIRQDHDH